MALKMRYVYAVFLSLFVGQLLIDLEAQEKVQESTKKYVAKQDSQKIDNFAYQRYFTKDKFDRQITFYLSKARRTTEALPLVVFVQGSGSQSLFWKMETEQGKIIVSGGQENVARRFFSDRVRILLVEKPGVTFLKQPSRPGSAEEGSKEFNREFSLSRWTEAINAAICATVKLPGIRKSPILVSGHSEGGQVACSVAAINPKVTHVGVLAGGGPTQLFDLMKFAEQGDLYDPKASAEDRSKALMEDWKKMLADPESTSKFILGHTHLRWSSFTKTSPIEALKKSKCKVIIAQGTADKNSLPISADVLYAELLSTGRDVRYLKIKDGNHGFMTKGDKGTGWSKTNRKVIEWFLKDVSAKAKK